MLNSTDDPEQAKRIFTRLVNVFSEQNISPSPLNYFVWYQYLKGDNSQFRQEMDSILNDPFGYNDRIGKRLYNDFLTAENKSDDNFDMALRRLISSMVNRMNSWSETLEEHTKELDICAESLSSPDINAEELKRLTSNIISTATSMQKNTEDLQTDMLTNAKEVEGLRHQLIEARAELLQDELTQIGNRKAFNNAIQELTLSASNDQSTLCLIIADIDHFKRFNDCFGHLVGDSVLRFFSNLMKKSKLKNESLSRYGGEEFTLLLNNSSLEEAQKRAESIRVAIESATLRRRNSSETLGIITASFGISIYRANESIDDFIKRADDALYYAKENGRNKIITEEQLPAETPTD